MSEGHYPDRSTAAERARWNERWEGLTGRELAASRWLQANAHYFPAGGRILDWASGDGRNGLWLAEQGFVVTLADISEVALATAAARAKARGVRVETRAIDLAEEEAPEGPWEGILCHHYFDPTIAERAVPRLAAGGRLLIHHPTRRNLERHPRPPAHFLYEEGELARRLAGYEVLLLSEEWTAAGRHEVSAVVENRPAPDEPHHP